MYSPLFKPGDIVKNYKNKYIDEYFLLEKFMFQDGDQGFLVYCMLFDFELATISTDYLNKNYTILSDIFRD